MQAGDSWRTEGEASRSKNSGVRSEVGRMIEVIYRMYGGICELAAENGVSGGCIRRPFHHNIQNVNVLKEDKMISSAFSVFSNVEVSWRPS